MITNNLLRMILIDKFLKVDRVLCVLAPLVLFSCLQQPLLNRHLFTSIGYYTGEIGVVDDSIARDYLEIAVLERDTLALMWLARVYSTGRMGFPKDATRALSIAKLVIDDVAKRAENGEPEALFLMGTAYAEALGVTINLQKSAEFYAKAAEMNHTLAMHNLGNIFGDGIGVERDLSQALHWWRRAAENGDTIPMLRLAELYLSGEGVMKDVTRACCWIKQSLQRGNSNAEIILQQRFDGECIETNYKSPVFHKIVDKI